MRKYLANLPAFILAIGAILRIVGTGASAIWFDESVLVYRSGIPFLRLWAEHSDSSGCLLLDIILRPLMALSQSVWMLRLPSMLAALVSLWLVWKLMRRLEFTLPQQIAAASFAAFLPGLLWIAQDARSYSLLGMLFLAALWYAIEGNWLGLFAVCGLTVYAHNIGPIFAVGAILIALYFHPLKWNDFILFFFVLFLAWIPAAIHISTMWIVQQPWQPILTFDWVVRSSLQSLWPMPWNDWIYFASFLVLGLTLLRVISITILRFFKKQLNNRIIPLFAWTLPLVGLLSSSWVSNNNFVHYRTLSVFLFPFALWLGWEISIIRWHAWIFGAAWISLLVAGLIYWHPAIRGGGLDQVATDIRSQWQDGDRLVYTTITVGLPFNYYLSDLPHTWDETIEAPFLAPRAISSF